MEGLTDLLSRLYDFKYFSLFIIIAIIVLLIVFVFVLFFGKKDKKEREIEATKRLMQINEENSDAFKETSAVNNVEVVNQVEPILEATNNNVEVENPLNTDELLNESIPPVPEVEAPIVEAPVAVEETPVDVPPIEPVMPTLEPVKDVEIPSDVVNPPINDIPVVENVVSSEVEEPVLRNTEESPLVVDIPTIETPEPPRLDVAPVNEAPAIEDIPVPEFDFDNLLKETEGIKNEEVKPVAIEEKKEEIKKAPEVFSSVYVPSKEENVQEEDDFELELPTLKKVEEETKNIEENMDMPILNDYNLDNLSGEVYDINR